MPIAITMPALSPTMTEGRLSKWTKQEGDAVASGDVIAEIETDKATMEVEAVDEGVLAKLVVAEGTAGVAVNSLIAVLLEEGEDADIEAFVAENTAQAASPAEEGTEETGVAGVTEAGAPAAPQGGGTMIAQQATRAPQAPEAKSSMPQGADGARAKASPVARKLAEQNGLALAGIHGTGPKGRIVKADVEAAIARGGTVGAVQRDVAEFSTEEHSMMRSTIAKRLLESKQTVPHFYLTISPTLDRLLAVRAELNAQAVRQAGKEAKPAWKISVNDCIIRAAALALRDVPEANVSWYDDAMVRYHNVDISVAVATEGGLITPIIHNADQKTIPQIATQMKQLAARARAGELQPEEYQGGGFSISNLGMYGIEQFSAIINPPQACILAVGAGAKQPVVEESGQIGVATKATLTLSVDHRAVDGAVGALYMQALQHYVEHPAAMLVG